MGPFLLCTDLDRTLLPNGEPPESPQARELLRRFADRDHVHLAYVTGRDRRLVEEAIDHYALPSPDWLIADVGTSLYRRQDNLWSRSQIWDAVLDRSWQGRSAEDLATGLAAVQPLTLQEPTKQGRYKLSCYHPLEADPGELRAALEQQLAEDGIAANLIFSVDEAAGVGLLDIVPAAANKLCALQFLIGRENYSSQHTLFAGDSGNDLEILVSDIPSVIVANARHEVIQQAQELARQAGTAAKLYVASGGFRGMNGNYGAGILEGLAHFHPDQVRDFC